MARTMQRPIMQNLVEIEQRMSACMREQNMMFLPAGSDQGEI